ncbi:MAG: hypothetical protein NTZ77_03275 [Caldiserica bacterium]|nr:hypothetical protein [Caldisericota bacterium]
MIAWLMSLVAGVNDTLWKHLPGFFVPGLFLQLLLGVALLLLYDAALWVTDRRLRHPQSSRTSLPYLLLDYAVFFEVMGWYTNYGKNPFGLLCATSLSLAAFLLVRLAPAFVLGHLTTAPDDQRHAWHSVVGIGGRILCLIAFATAIPLLLLCLWWLFVVTFINS